MTNALFAQAKTSTTRVDQTVDTGGFDDSPPPAGPTMARFVGYVETGKRPGGEYLGKPKPDCQQVRVYFELNSKKHLTEVDKDGVKTTWPNIQSERMMMKLGDKASFKKLFNKMTYGRAGITHMTDMLGEPFLIHLIHNIVKAEGKPDKTYANMKDDDGTWLISAPVVVDPVSEETTVLPVPEMTAPAKLLLWDSPTDEQWASIFIDGTRTVKDAKTGVESEKSKNWLQEDIVANALDFQGSALQAMLGGIADLTLTEGEGDGDVLEDDAAFLAGDTVPEVPLVTPKEEAPLVDPDATPAATKPAPVAAASGDIMGDLGL